MKEHEHKWGTMTWHRGESHVHACLHNSCGYVLVGERRKCASLAEKHTIDGVRASYKHLMPK